jgi:hypothetical protein
MPADSNGWLEPRDLIENGAHHRWPDGAFSTLEVIEVCRLVLPTGRIAATDPAFDVWPDSELMLA